MFIIKYENEATINPYVLPGLLNDFKLDLVPQVVERNLDSLLSQVCIEMNVQEDDIKSQSRKREFIIPRHVFFYLAEKYTKYCLRTIGEFIGGRDHTTVIHGRDNIKNLIDVDENINNTVLTVENKIILSNKGRDLVYETIRTVKNKKPKKLRRDAPVKVETMRFKGIYSNPSFAS